MSHFKIATVNGEYEHHGPLSVLVLGQTDEKKRQPFSVALTHGGGAMRFQFHLTPDQSRDLRAALEEAESKAEILTAAI